MAYWPYHLWKRRFRPRGSRLIRAMIASKLCLCRLTHLFHSKSTQNVGYAEGKRKRRHIWITIQELNQYSGDKGLMQTCMNDPRSKIPFYSKLRDLKLPSLSLQEIDTLVFAESRHKRRHVCRDQKSKIFCTRFRGAVTLFCGCKRQAPSRSLILQSTHLRTYESAKLSNAKNWLPVP